MTAFIIAITPLVINVLMSVSKRLADVQDTAGKRILLGMLSVIGVVAGNLLSGSPIDPASLNGAVQEVLLSGAAFLAAHGSYNLFKSVPEQSFFTEEDYSK